MKRFRDVTFGEAFTRLAEYRTVLVGVLLIGLLLVVLPDPKNTGGALDAGSTRTGDGFRSAAPDGTTVDTTPGSSLDGSAALAGTDPGSSSVRGSSGGTGGVAAASGLGWRAMGSPDALAAKDCDRNTKYLNMPTKVFAFPCVPAWPKGADNGGATAPGVTKDSVKVIVYKPMADPATQAALVAAGVADTDQQLEDTLVGVQKLYARHAELYGRKLQLIRMDASGSTVENERADAIQAINQYHPFASMTLAGTCGTGDGKGPGFVYEMALRGVQGVCSTTSSLSNLMAAEPHLWITPNQGVMLAEQHLLFTAELMCKRLKGKPAKWAGDPLLRSKIRKFGYLYIDTPETAAAKKVFEQALANCGLKVDSFGLSNDVAQGQEQTPTAIAKFSAAGDTVVVLDAGFINSGVASKQATNQNYRPEWLETGFAYTDATIFVRATWDANQARSLYGVREVSLQTPKAAGDGWSLYRWENGENPPAKLLGLESQMPAWHALFAGIHLAGPKLTSAAFTDALVNLPPFGGSYQGAVSSVGKSFGRRGIWPWESDKYFDNSGVDDTTFTWWSATAQGEDESGNNGVGMMMFVDGGKRFRLGTLPTSEPDFFGTNGIAAVGELGPADKPPSYQNKMGCDTREACYG
jgi:hypothetical protein